MENLKDDYALADVIADEHSEVLWSAIQTSSYHARQENTTCDPLGELVRKLEEVRTWTNQTTSE